MGRPHDKAPVTSGWTHRVFSVPGFSFAFFSFSLFVRYLAFSQTPYANGWDGYFYINQIRSFMEEGKMDVPDASLVYPLMMLIQFFTKDYIISYKLMACLLAASFTVSLFFLSLKWAKDFGIALLIASFCVFSPHLTYFAAQYPKNLLGIILFLWLLYSVDSKKKLIPWTLLVLNFFGHRVTAVLGFLFLALNLVFQKFTKHIPYLLALFLLLLLIAGFFLPGLINLFDAERFRGIFSGHPQFAPYSFITMFGTNLISPWWLSEIILSCIVFSSAFVYAAVLIAKGSRHTQLTITLIILSILIFPFFKWSIEGPSFRFFLIFVLLWPLPLTLLLPPIRNKYLLTVLCAVPIILGFLSYKNYNPAKHDPPYGLYHKVCKKITSKINSDSCELIIAHKSLAEYIVFTTGIDAMSWIPEYEIQPEKLWRVAEGVKEVQFKFYLNPTDLKFVHRLTPSYSLVREDVWTRFFKSVEKNNNKDLIHELNDWKNPNSLRPRYMLKNKR